MAAGERGDTGVKSVQLAFDVLEAVAEEADDVGVSELAVRLGTTKGTVFRHLQTLVERGYVVQNSATSRYRLGVRSHVLGMAAAKRIDLLTASADAVRDLRYEIGETVVISAVTPQGLIVLATVLGKSPLEIGVRTGSNLPLHATAQGKVALAFSGSQLAGVRRRQGLNAFTDNTIVSPDALDAEIQRITALGYATAPEEDLLGINALAAPILGADGLAVGTIAIVGSIQSIPRTAAQEQIDAILRAATRASWNLGYTGHIPRTN